LRLGVQVAVVHQVIQAQQVLVVVAVLIQVYPI
jgi:hypothetical protein